MDGRGVSARRWMRAGSHPFHPLLPESLAGVLRVPCPPTDLRLCHRSRCPQLSESLLLRTSTRVLASCA